MVLRDDCQQIDARFMGDIDTNTHSFAFLFEREMPLDLLARMGAQITFGEALQKAQQFGRGRSTPVRRCTVVYPVRGQFTRELFRAQGIDAPQLFRAPGSHGGGIDGTNIGIREQSEAQQIFLCANS